MVNHRDISRFESKFQIKDNGCWDWIAGKKGGGYGAFWLLGALRGAHRAALFLYRGQPLDTQMDAMHSCDNPSCVNPDHLSYGTRAENMRDASKKGRTVRVQDWKGTLNPKSKLSKQQRQEIESHLLMGRKKRFIARDFGVTTTRIQQIAREFSGRRDGSDWKFEEF